MTRPRKPLTVPLRAAKGEFIALKGGPPARPPSVGGMTIRDRPRAALQ
jgi:hypothetical protein